jgi:hypothetical protein
LRIKIIYCSLCASSVSGNASVLTEIEVVQRTCGVRAKVTVDRVSRSITRPNCVTLAKGVIRRCGRGTRGSGIFSGGFDGRRSVTKCEINGQRGKKNDIDMVKEKLRRTKTENALRGSLSPIDGAFGSFG